MLTKRDCNSNSNSNSKSKSTSTSTSSSKSKTNIFIKLLKYLYVIDGVYILILILIIGIFFLYKGIYFLYKYIKNKESYVNNTNNNENKIIIPDIIGGLGNQLFIVASAFAFSKDNNYKLMLDNRNDVYSYGKPRPTYNKTVFTKIPITTIDTKDFTKLNENDYASGNYKDNKDNKYNTDNKSKNIFLTGGYYQEAKYFDKYRNELLDLLEPTTESLNKVNEIFKKNNININNDFLVAIHIRLDDVYTPIDADKRVYDPDEYDKIIEKLPEHIKTNSNTKFIIFSNDGPRTKDIFKNAKIEDSKMIYIQDEDYIELYLMSKCNDYIASPSTFNWWGIYLNRNLNRKIFVYWKQDSDYRKDFYKKYEYLMGK